MSGNADMPEKVLITGASGLLGTALTEHLSALTSVIPLSHTSNFPGMRKIDLLDNTSINAISNMEWDAMIHCAAYRSPDFCAEHKTDADSLNTEVPRQLAETAAEKNARFIHISTDYVFKGDNPPYSEEDHPEPVNYYGETKLKAEIAIKKIYPESVILRIPALYGTPPPPIESTLLKDAAEAVKHSGPSLQDNTIARFPTFTEDIAEVIAFLLKSDFTGILHASAPEKATRYNWAMAVADVLGFDSGHIGILDHDPDRKAARPLNSQLSVSKLASLNAPLPRPFSEVLPGIIDYIKSILP